MSDTRSKHSGRVSRDFHLTESVESLIALDSHQARALEGLAKELASSKDWWGATDQDEVADRRVISVRPHGDGQYLCTIRNAVGVVALEGVRIFSEPKIPMDHFVYIAKHSLFGDGRTVNSETSVGDGQSFLDLISIWLVASAANVVRGGLSRDYELQDDPIPYVRGRLDAVRTSLNFLRGNLDVRAEYEERTPNAPENRILATALRLVKPDLLGDPELSRTLSQLGKAFEDVDFARASDFQIPNRNFPARYRRPIDLAKSVIRHAGISLSAGNRSAQSFLVRTPNLIEDGIRQILNKWLAPIPVRAGAKILQPTTLRVSPDLLVARPPFTADVKYKRFASTWDRRDLAQSVFFAESFQSPIAAVIGFSKGNTLLPVVPVGRISVTPIAWDISEGASPEDSASQIVEQMYGWVPDTEKIAPLVSSNP